MKRLALLMGVFIATAVLCIFASGNSSSSTLGTLRGNYILQVAGACTNCSVGEITGLGALSFKSGGSLVSPATVTFSVGGATLPTDCRVSISEGSAVAGSMTLSFCPDTATCSQVGSLNFIYSVERGGLDIRVMLTSFTMSSPSICDVFFGGSDVLTLAGDLAKQ